MSRSKAWLTVALMEARADRVVLEDRNRELLAASRHGVSGVRTCQDADEELDKLSRENTRHKERLAVVESALREALEEARGRLFNCAKDDPPRPDHWCASLVLERDQTCWHRTAAKLFSTSDNAAFREPLERAHELAEEAALTSEFYPPK
jgi:hypothetical protein